MFGSISRRSTLSNTSNDGNQNFIMQLNPLFKKFCACIREIQTDVNTTNICSGFVVPEKKWDRNIFGSSIETSDLLSAGMVGYILRHLNESIIIVATLGATNQ